MTVTPLPFLIGERSSSNAGELFESRHVGPTRAARDRMLGLLGFATLEDLVQAALPPEILDTTPLLVPEASSERQLLEQLRTIASENDPGISMIGMGFHGTLTPPVIQRNVVENPAWYTAYTPYQPEISQGRLEVLLAFQTLVEDLTGLPVAGASLLDEATAAAEAMAMMRRLSSAGAGAAFVVDEGVNASTTAVIRTRAAAFGIPVVVKGTDSLPEVESFGLLLQYPDTLGRVDDPREIIEQAHEQGLTVALATDPLALTLLTPPGELGADIAVGSTQRFGVPMGFGGPHAAFLASRAEFARSMPGRLVGISRDASGRPALRLALQTREQHIRRERATSNICTSQVLLAIVATLYAAYHGPKGLTRIAGYVAGQAATLGSALEGAGISLASQSFFDTVTACVPGRADHIVGAAAARGIHLRRVSADRVAVSCDELTTTEVLSEVAAAFDVELTPSEAPAGPAIPTVLARKSRFLEHEVFNAYRSETGMMRYLRRLSDRDLALDRTMIPLGSCTMKLNSAAAMASLTWPKFTDLHPFVPVGRAAGMLRIIRELSSWLAEITGYDAVSLQPNAGSQGEFAGLLAIRAYHRSRGEADRDVCLIPASAHGTNAASAVMAGLRVVVVACDENGSIDRADLARLLGVHSGRLAAVMLTYPSTHGVFEEGIREVCAAVHDAGGQVYVDGANLNAMVGLARPGRFGADVSHINLHKTFSIPHGGGGPGVGPVAVRAHLAPFLPNHPLAAQAGPASGPGPVSGAPYGSAGILAIAWAYIRLMGPEGLRRASETAILTANYVAARLRPHFPILFTGRGGLVAHECIVDLRGVTAETGITAEDVAKRLIDYGFHAPTLSFPVAGTLMIEPTESEGIEELDRFCSAMAGIRAEIDRVASGEWDRADNPLRNAPHTAEAVTGPWGHAYERQLAAFPVPELRQDKYWPPVGRVDQAYGDRNLVCACQPVTSFADPVHLPS